MTEPAGNTSRRRLGIVVAVAALVVGGVVGATFLIRSREPQRSVAAVCADLEQAKDLDRALTSLDPSTLEQRLGSLRAAVRTAPSDIEPQIAALARFVSTIVDEVDAAPATDRREALAEALAVHESEVDGITAAGDVVEIWTAENCGIELGGATTSVAQ
jgi:hypothetical protein